MEPALSLSDRYLDLLDEAYAATETPARYDDLMDRARLYFFGATDSPDLAADIVGGQTHDDALEAHLPRIKSLFERYETTSTAANADTFHARLTVSQRDLIVTRNQAASRLTGLIFPCHADDLPFDYATLSFLKGAAIKSDGKTPLDRVILTTIETPDIRSCLALVQRPADANKQLTISISYIDWSPELMTRIGSAFGLTTAETGVLEGLVQNLSQREIAEATGRSTDTIKAHAKSILRKAGCARMSDVVQLAASIAYLVRLYPEQDASALMAKWETPTSNMARLKRGTRQLAYYTYGAGDVPILFIHGFLQGPFFTDAFIQGLTAQNLHLICPSRPGFGYTSPSQDRASYEQVIVADTIALLDHLKISKCAMAVHQLSSSHAYRIALAQTERFTAMLMISASPTINDEKHMAHMDSVTRVAAAAARYTPSVLKLINQMGIATYRKRGGPEAFLRKRYKQSSLDLATLDNPDLRDRQIEGVYHYIEQGSEALVRDAKSSMNNWGDLIDQLKIPQAWYHGARCTALKPSLVKDYVDARIGAPYTIVEDASTNLLHQRPDIIVNALAQLATAID